MRGGENADARTFEQEIEGTTNHLAGFLILRIKKALGPLLIGLLFLRSLQNIPKLQIKSFQFWPICEPGQPTETKGRQPDRFNSEPFLGAPPRFPPWSNPS